MLSPDFVPVDLHQRGHGYIIMQASLKVPGSNNTQEGIITVIFITEPRRLERV